MNVILIPDEAKICIKLKIGTFLANSTLLWLVNF